MNLHPWRGCSFLKVTALKDAQRRTWICLELRDTTDESVGPAPESSGFLARRPGDTLAGMPTPPVSHDIWVNEFVNELMRLRPDLGPQFVLAVAQSEWPRRREFDPRAAALEWNERVKSARP